MSVTYTDIHIRKLALQLSHVLGHNERFALMRWYFGIQVYKYKYMYKYKVQMHKSRKAFNV